MRLYLEIDETDYATKTIIFLEPHFSFNMPFQKNNGNNPLINYKGNKNTHHYVNILHQAEDEDPLHPHQHLLHHNP